LNLPSIHNSVVIGQYCAIGDDGFNFIRDADGKLIHTEHQYSVIIKENVWIGSHVSIDKGRWRDTVVNGGSKIDNHAHISHNCIIGEDCIIGAHATILGSVTIGDRSEIWSNSVIHQGVSIGDNCAVGANSYIRHNVPDNHVAYMYGGSLIVKPREDTKKYGKKDIEEPTMIKLLDELNGIKREGGVPGKCLNGKCKDTTW
jgi:UDP-3-O-[3-hydroxymyristoyl] glucosamine N-acyltransferase